MMMKRITHRYQLCITCYIGQTCNTGKQIITIEEESTYAKVPIALKLILFEALRDSEG